MWKSTSTTAAGGLVGILVLSSLASALNINGYTPANYDRFSSGYPSAPINNTSSSFIGLGYDWSGVGWSATNDTQSFALLGSQFILYANHYTPAVGSTINFTTGNGTVYNNTVASVSGQLILGSDLAIAALSSPISSSANITSYPILFLGYSGSPYYTAYKNLLLYGWTARIGTNSISSIVQFSGDSGYYLKYNFDTTTAGRATVVSGDSGSPTFVVASTGELCVVGDHYAIYNDGSGGVDSFLALELPYISAFMAKYGYLPSVLTPPTTTWKSSSSTSWGNSGNWSGGAVPADVFSHSGTKLTTCASVLFDAASASQLTISLDGNQTVTGITFAAATGSNGFTIATGTSGNLTIGEAGIRNKDDDVQTFACNIVMRSSQIWDVGQGGLLVTGSINTDTGDLLLIQGGGNAAISGLISNSGGLAKDGSGTLTLNGTISNTYTGTTFIHNGGLKIGDGGADGSLGTGAVADDAVLAFNRSDVITVSNLISGSGKVQQIGSGTLILSGSNTYTGTTTITNGFLKLANSSALGTNAGGTIVQNGGTLDLNGTTIGAGSLTIYGTGNSGSGALTNSNISTTAVYNGAVTLGANASTGGSGNILISGALNCGTFALTKTGSSVLSLTGSQIWGDNSSITVLGGTLSYQQTAIAATTVAASTPTLYIASGATLNVDASNNDPFTDDTTSTQHVRIVNYATGSLNLTAGTVSVAGISGDGDTTVTGGATLTADYICQNVLTIGAGSTLAINAIDVSSSASLSSNSALTPVPEPSSLLMLVLAGMYGLMRFIWKRKF
ncbi:MAG: autotransporter-associated beta strand repeat-containing protein [Thermoguttaceae bacterium]|jgi:autotransporter-associated beta strand protein